MSERTFERRFVRARVWAMLDWRRRCSVRCWVRISRWRERFVVFRAEGVGSESRVRERVERRVERCCYMLERVPGVFRRCEFGWVTYFLEDVV